MYWNNSVPTSMQLLAVLRSSGLRKFELVMQWLEDVHDITVQRDKKNSCSERDQMDKLIQSVSQLSLAYEIVSGYKNKLEVKINRGETSIRSARLALKPAVALMLSMGQENTQLPDLEHIKTYLAEYSGQAAALTGFINFLSENFGTSIDYLTLKKSEFLTTKRKQKLENKIIALVENHSNESKDIINWVRNGLKYFHHLSYIDSLKIKSEMITEVDDGFRILFNCQFYWIPKKIYSK